MNTAARTGWVLVSLLGSAQAVLLALALAFRTVNWRANRLLAALLLVMGLYLASGAYQASDWVMQWPQFFGWSHPTPLLFGPLVYLYAIHATDADRPWRRMDWLHFVPALLVVSWSMPVYLLSPADTVALAEQLRTGVIPSQVALNLQMTHWLKLASGVVYTTLTVRVVRAHQRSLPHQYSSLERLTLDWLLMLAGASVVIWLVVVLATIVEPAGLVPAGTGDALIAVGMTAVIYLVGYRGLVQSEIHRLLPDTEPPPSDIPPPERAVDEPGAHAVRSERRQLSPGQASAMERRLHEVMESERLWRQSDLTLSDLARRLETSTHKLSEVLNDRVEKTFHDYVNAYRVQDVQQQLTQPDAGARTLLAMGLDAGFASKSTFNAVFRKHTGMTPSAWRDAQGH